MLIVLLVVWYLVVLICVEFSFRECFELCCVYVSSYVIVCLVFYCKCVVVMETKNVVALVLKLVLSMWVVTPCLWDVFDVRNRLRLLPFLYLYACNTYIYIYINLFDERPENLTCNDREALRT